jgi:hypothetical protein
VPVRHVLPDPQGDQTRRHDLNPETSRDAADSSE